MDELDALYALAPEEFVAARDALVRQLRKDGRREEATEVAARRRPSAAAWALNQVARQAPAVVEVALAAGHALRGAADEALAGDAAGLRAATAAERAAAHDVVRQAGTILGSRATGQREAMLATLRVAALDEEVADQLRAGVLTTDHAQPGFGFGDLGAADVAPARTHEPKAARRTKATASGAGEDKATAEPRATAKSAAKGKGKTTTRDAEAASRSTGRAKEAAAANRAAERARRKELAARRRTAERLEREATRLAKEADAAAAEAERAADEAAEAAGRAAEARAAVEAIEDDGPGASGSA